MRAPARAHSRFRPEPAGIRNPTWGPIIGLVTKTCHHYSSALLGPGLFGSDPRPGRDRPVPCPIENNNGEISETGPSPQFEPVSEPIGGPRMEIFPDASFPRWPD